MQEEVSPSEWVARFIMQKSYFRSSDRTARHNAFMPNRNGETSVYRTIDLSEKEIYEIGQIYVAEPLGKRLFGHAEIVVSTILDQRLKVEPHPHPHPRHANIVDWPEDKSKHKMIALELAAYAQLHLIDSS